MSFLAGRITLFTASAALIVGVAATLAHSQTTGDAPIRCASRDTHRVAFENAFVRILEVRVPAGKTEPRHRHPHGLSVYFSDWEAKGTVDGKPAQVNPRKTGTFAWSDAVVHTVENVGKTDGHVLRIELKYLEARAGLNRRSVRRRAGTPPPASTPSRNDVRTSR